MVSSTSGVDSAETLVAVRTSCGLRWTAAMVAIPNASKITTWNKRLKIRAGLLRAADRIHAPNPEASLESTAVFRG